MIRCARRAVLGVAFAALVAAVHAADAYRWQLPRGFPEPAVPADNPMSAEKVALGARLFADPRLSVTERYTNKAGYVAAVTAAANALKAKRLLLDADVQAYITNAQNSTVLP